MAHLSKHAPPSLTLEFLHTLCKCPVSSIFWACFQWAFGLTPLSIVFINTYTQNYYSLAHWPPPRFFVVHTGLGTQAWWGCTLSPLMMQVALVVHSLAWTQVGLISCSTRSAILPDRHSSRRDCRLCIDCKLEGHMHETNWIFKQTPPSHFCLEVMCKKEGAYFRELTICTTHVLQV